MGKYSICPVCRVNQLGMDNNGAVRKKCLNCSYRSNTLEKLAAEPKSNESQIFLCSECNSPFKRTSHLKKYCGELCADKGRIRKLNEKWLGKEYKEPEARDHGMNDKIARANLYRNKPKWLKKYEHCRG